LIKKATDKIENVKKNINRKKSSISRYLKLIPSHNSKLNTGKTEDLRFDLHVLSQAYFKYQLFGPYLNLI
jgi:hypothetical protein